jgi:hypothetical protein
MDITAMHEDWFLTFPEEFRDHRETHPTFPAAHPDGWVRISAPDFASAFQYARETFGNNKDAGRNLWTSLTLEGFFLDDTLFYPLGELSHHTVGMDYGHEPTC